MPSKGYIELIRTNADYRRLWFGGAVSDLGGWFNLIALYTLIRQLTGSPLALGIVFFLRTMSWALASPFGGLIADRVSRRRLMIAADLVRALVVLGFLLVDEARELPLLYGLFALQVVIGTVFTPARRASIPNITSEQELLTANALSTATAASLIAVGAALGGLATEWLGIRQVFLIDSLSFLVSAFFISRTSIPQSTEAASGRGWRDALSDIADGWRYMRSHPRVGRIAVTKSAWAVAGSGLVYMLALLGGEVMPYAPAIGIGLLYGARGLGTGLGPVAARRWVPERTSWPTLFGLGMVASGVAYLFAGSLPFSALTFVFVALAHGPFGANWALSTVLLQERTADRYRGRVFSTELLLLSLAGAAGNLSASLLLELSGVTLRPAMLLYAALLSATGVLWLAFAVPQERRDEEKAGAEQGS